jgi:hypothetical protein
MDKELPSRRKLTLQKALTVQLWMPAPLNPPHKIKLTTTVQIEAIFVIMTKEKGEEGLLRL